MNLHLGATIKVEKLENMQSNTMISNRPVVNNSGSELILESGVWNHVGPIYCSCVALRIYFLHLLFKEDKKILSYLRCSAIH
jgi:hypothetical protein